MICYTQRKLSSTCEEFKFRGWYDAAFQSPIREVKMLAVWPSIAEGFPTAKFKSYMQ